jgi:hypothetical protein
MCFSREEHDDIACAKFDALTRQTSDVCTAIQQRITIDLFVVGN